MATLISAVAIGAGTQSTGGQVHFTGEITEDSCNINSGSSNQVIDLGKWSKDYFTNSVIETTKIPFNISVANCPQSVKTVAVLFDGVVDINNKTLLSINSGTGNATGVGIKIYEDDRSSAITLGTATNAHSVVKGSGSAGGTANLTFFADYMANGTTISPGQANSTADFNMVYN
ncbi:fimbrial protein [Citrobacter portucalensis]|nr:fimbrial protein [Citrobacter portucalensis]MCX9039280.1 fimbrial protein [Citrobacter portucalensis]MCX9063403.1 fimbrial protein [Citrobacter portucalensis]